MDIFSVYATDEVAEVEGRWFPLDKNTKVRVARTGNPNYIKALRQRMKDNSVDSEDSSAENEALVTGLIVETLAETVLLGWSGIQFKGAEMPYSIANAKTLLEVKGFRKRITDIADKLESFRLKDEVAQGNA